MVTYMSSTYTTKTVEASKIDALLKAKASDLNWYTKTLRNAIRAARKNSTTYYVVRTATQAHIAKSYDIADAAGETLDFIVNADGTVAQAVWA